MILAPHIIISGILGSQTGSYFLAAVLGLASHYALDAIPHWDYLPGEFEKKARHEKGFIKSKLFWKEIAKIALDMIIGFVLLFIFIDLDKNANVGPAIISAIFGILPDPLSLLYWVTKWKFIKWNIDLQSFSHYLFSSKTKPRFWPGIATQTATIGIVLLILYGFQI